MAKKMPLSYLNVDYERILIAILNNSKCESTHKPYGWNSGYGLINVISGEKTTQQYLDQGYFSYIQ